MSFLISASFSKAIVFPQDMQKFGNDSYFFHNTDMLSSQCLHFHVSVISWLAMKTSTSAYILSQVLSNQKQEV